MKADKGTSYQKISHWLCEHSGWWTRAEMCTGVGLLKTAHSVRVIEQMVKNEHAIKTSTTEHGRFCWIYSYNGNDAEFLPF
jgi:hypothetical protein